MKPTRLIALLSAISFALINAGGCAVLTVDVDVYKGPLANHRDVQMQQAAMLVVAAKPILAKLRWSLEKYERQQQFLDGDSTELAKLEFSDSYLIPRSPLPSEPAGECDDKDYFPFYSQKAQFVNRLLSEYNSKEENEHLRSARTMATQPSRGLTQSASGLKTLLGNQIATDPCAGKKWIEARGRATPGLETVVAIYQEAKLTADNAGYDSQNGLPPRTMYLPESGLLFDILIQFSERLLFAANNDVLFGEKSGILADVTNGAKSIFKGGNDPGAARQAYVRVLQAVGNSILLNLDEIREQFQHDQDLVSGSPREAAARDRGYHRTPYQVVTDLISVLAAAQGSAKSDLDKAEARQKDAIATVEKLTKDLKAAQDKVTAAKTAQTAKGDAQADADRFANTFDILDSDPQFLAFIKAYREEDETRRKGPDVSSPQVIDELSGELRKFARAEADKARQTKLLDAANKLTSVKDDPQLGKTGRHDAIYDQVHARLNELRIAAAAKSEKEIGEKKAAVADAQKTVDTAQAALDSPQKDQETAKKAVGDLTPKYEAARDAYEEVVSLGDRILPERISAGDYPDPPQTIQHVQKVLVEELAHQRELLAREQANSQKTGDGSGAKPKEQPQVKTAGAAKPDNTNSAKQQASPSQVAPKNKVPATTKGATSKLATTEAAPAPPVVAPAPPVTPMAPAPPTTTQATSPPTPPNADVIKAIKAKIDRLNHAIDAVSNFKIKETPIDTAGLKAHDAKEVVDGVIAALDHEYVDAVRQFGKDSTTATNIKAALDAAYARRTDMVYIRPASAYLRTSFPSTSLQRDARLGWKNMLTEQEIHQLPFSDLFQDQQYYRTLQELDKQYWQNINTVRVAGGGDTNYVLVKDDVGNWYVKNYSSDPKDIINSAKNLALFGLGPAIGGGLDLIHQAAKSGTDPSLAPAAQPTALESQFTDEEGKYKTATATDRRDVLTAAKSLDTTLVNAWASDASLDKFKDQLATTVTGPRKDLLDPLPTADQAETDEKNATKEKPAPRPADQIIDTLQVMRRFHNAVVPNVQKTLTDDPAKALKTAQDDKAKADDARKAADKAVADLQPDWDKKKAARDQARTDFDSAKTASDNDPNNQALKTALTQATDRKTAAEADFTTVDDQMNALKKDQAAKKDTADKATQIVKDKDQALTDAKDAAGKASAKATELIRESIKKIVDRRRTAIARFDTAIEIIGDSTSNK